MSGITTARKALAARLATHSASSGFRVYDDPRGTFSAPCFRIHPGAGWVTTSTLSGTRRTQTWEVWAVVSRLDSSSNVDELEDMVAAAILATKGSQEFSGWGSLNFERPGPTQMSGVVYWASRGIIQTVMEV